MSILRRALVPLWGRGNKFLWKPGGVFLTWFQDFRINFLSLFVLKFFLGKCEILNPIEKPLRKHFSIWKNVMGCQFIRKPIWFATKNHFGNGFLFPKSRFWIHSKNPAKNHLGDVFLFQKKVNFQCIRKTTWFTTKNHLKMHFYFKKSKSGMHSKNHLVYSKKSVRNAFLFQKK